MQLSHFILTDSGGIQEEAPNLRKPVLVLREFTERIEGVKAGFTIPVGSNAKCIIDEVTKLLDDSCHYEKMSHPKSSTELYGDGKASQRIVEIIKNKI